MTKREARRIYLEKRRLLTKEEVELRSLAICNNFFAVTDLHDVNVVHVFLPIRKNNEPDTWLIIRKLRSDYPRIRISVPRVRAGTNLLDHFFLGATSTLKENGWGIPEIHSGDETKIEDIDIVLVPLLVFDQSGNRVGYGKGFYDRFLAQCKATTSRVGISLFEGIEDIDDVDAFDEPLHRCITPYDVQDF